MKISEIATFAEFQARLVAAWAKSEDLTGRDFLYHDVRYRVEGRSETLNHWTCISTETGEMITIGQRALRILIREVEARHLDEVEGPVVFSN